MTIATGIGLAVYGLVGLGAVGDNTRAMDRMAARMFRVLDASSRLETARRAQFHYRLQLQEVIRQEVIDSLGQAQARAAPASEPESWTEF